jgi:hypothetical protein
VSTAEHERRRGNVTLAVMTPHTHGYEFTPLPQWQEGAPAMPQAGAEVVGNVPR